MSKKGIPPQIFIEERMAMKLYNRLVKTIQNIPETAVTTRNARNWRTKTRKKHNSIELKGTCVTPTL